MNTDFINVFFENISHFNYSKEFHESIKMHTTVYEELYSEKTYLDFLEKFEKNVFPEYEFNFIQKWNSYRQDSHPRTISLTINERTGELNHVIMSHDELEFKFLKKYIFEKSIIFFDGFSLYNDYAHANSFEQEEYLGYIENFKFHLNSKISRIRFSNQLHIIKSILEGLKSYKIFFDSSYEYKIIDSQFLDLTQPLKTWEGIKSVIINETQIFKPIETGRSPIDIIEPLLEIIPSPTGENNQIYIETNEKNSLDYYMKSDLKLEILTINLYIEYLVNFTITKNKTGVFFMTEKCLINSIERIFKGNNNAKKAKIQYDKGEFGFVIQLFYLLYRKITHSVAFPRLTFQIMISTNFEFNSHEISTGKIDSHFRNDKGKNEWKLKDTKK